MKELRLADGRRLAYREGGQGAPLVFLHGWSMSSAVFDEVLAALAGRWRVLAPDLRGHGGSEAGPGFALADFAADLAEWMAALDLSGAGLVGWSLGGQVALELYPRVSPRVRRLSLVAATPRFCAGADWPHGLPLGQVRAMDRDLRRHYEKTMGDFFALQFAGEELDRERYRRIVAFAVRGGSLPAPEVARAALETLRRADQRSRLAGIAVPALVLHGDSDAIVPAAAGRYLAGELPEGRLVLLPGVGHAPFLSCPELCCDHWRSFFA